MFASPVPTQTTFGFVRATAIAPIDIIASTRSNAGVHDTPLLTLLNTPPLAAATYTASGWPGARPTARSSTRPPVLVGPISRNFRLDSQARSIAAGEAVCCASIVMVGNASTRTSAQPANRRAPTGNGLSTFMGRGYPHPGESDHGVHRNRGVAVQGGLPRNHGARRHTRCCSTTVRASTRRGRVERTAASTGRRHNPAAFARRSAAG